VVDLFPSSRLFQDFRSIEQGFVLASVNEKRHFVDYALKPASARDR